MSKILSDLLNGAASLLLIISLFSCSGKSNGGNADSDSVIVDLGSVAYPDLDVKHTVFKDTYNGNLMVCCRSMIVDIPESDNKALNDSICTWIVNNLYSVNEYKGDIEDFKSIFKHLVKEFKVFCRERDNEMSKIYEPDAYLGEGECSVRFTKVWENEFLVSYYCYHNIFYPGGTHGLNFDAGATFMKSSGEKLSWDIFTDRKRILSQYKKSVKIFYDQYDHDMGKVALPSSGFYVCSRGFVLSDSGLSLDGLDYPCDTIPFSELKDIMTDEVKQLLKVE